MAHHILVVLLLTFVVMSFGISESFADTASGKPIWEKNSNNICGDKLCSDVNTRRISDFPPPHRQISAGISTDNVKCIEDFLLVFKASNNSPACVKQVSVEKLIQRGWAIKSSDALSLVRSFEGCIDAGYQITKSISQECMFPSEKSFLENIDGTGVSEKALIIWNYALEKQQSESVGEYIKGPTEDGYEIVWYDVVGNDITQSMLPELPTNLLQWQQDKEKHKQVWDVFSRLIPESQRNVSSFYLTTDGVDGVGGGINRDITDTSRWHLFYDILDAYPTETFDNKEIIYTTIHEFGHIFTSGTDQIDVDMQLFNLLYYDTDEDAINNMYSIKSEECYPKLMVEDGCAKNNSYINLFYQKFWIDIISEWNEIQYIEDEDEFLEQSYIFYESYQDRFVTVYASTNVDEDISESWTAFVLNSKPEGNSIAEQKMLFFYDYAELVDLRDHIRNRL